MQEPQTFQEALRRLLAEWLSRKADPHQVTADLLTEAQALHSRVRWEPTVRPNPEQPRPHKRWQT